MKIAGVLAALLAAVLLAIWLLSGEAAAPPAGEPVAPAASPVAPETRFAALPAPESHDVPPAQQAVASPLPVPLGGPAEGGLVVRASDGSPLDGVVVRALAIDPAGNAIEVGSCTTVKGRFDFGTEVTTRGPRFLTFTWTEPAQHYPKKKAGEAARTVTDRIALAELRTPLDEIREELDTGWLARGRVIDAEGKALAGVAVLRADGVGAATDGAGEFVIRDIAPEAGTLRLSFSRRGLETVPLDVEPPGAGRHESSVEVKMLAKAPPH